MDNKKFEMLINLIDELDDFEITSIENLQKARDRKKLYNDMNHKMFLKLFHFEYKECERCNVRRSDGEHYKMIHAVFNLLKNNNEKMTFKELSKICECQIITIRNFLNSKYNCNNFENCIIYPLSTCEHKKEEKRRNMEHVLNIAKQYEGGITIAALAEKSGLCYATVLKFAKENKEIAEHIKYLRVA